jgi:hypothetical protein
VAAVPQEEKEAPFLALFSIQDITDLSRSLEAMRSLRRQALAAEAARRQSELTARALLDANLASVVLLDRNVKMIGNGSGDYFKFLDDIHHMRDHDRRLLEVIELPVYDGNQFEEWIESPKGGYLIC